MRAKHLLVVDDDPAMRDIIGTFLAERDFRVSTAADGKEMARILARDPVDLIILDLKLGDEDGLDLMRRLPEQTRGAGHRGHGPCARRRPTRSSGWSSGPTTM